MKLLNAIPAAELRPNVEYTAVVGPAGDLLALFSRHDDAAEWVASAVAVGADTEGTRLVEVRAVP